MTYRGEQIPVSKAYDSYEEYKDDPDNLPKEQIERVERAFCSLRRCQPVLIHMRNFST